MHSYELALSLYRLQIFTGNSTVVVWERGPKGTKKTITTRYSFAQEKYSKYLSIYLSQYRLGYMCGFFPL